MAMFAPGPAEMLIILFLLGVFGLPVLILIVLFATGKLSSPKPQSPPCASCGGWTFPDTRYCPHCGSPLNPPENPSDPSDQ
jgi:hypothetical protein